MKEKEQISEEFARKLSFGLEGPNLIIKMWKDKGYIKKSKEEEIREQLSILYEKYKKDFSQNFPKDIEDYIMTMTNIKNLQKKLIEILDNKNKGM